jgi:hypothetical protein
MGTSRTAAQFGKKINALAKEMTEQRGTANKVGVAGKQIFLAAGAGAVGRKPAGKRKIIGARYDLVKDSAGRSTVVVTYTGPAHLINNPTKPHRIEPRRPRGSRSRRKGRQALTIGGDLRAGADHPGTKGKNFYRKARAECVKVLPGVYGKSAITEPLRKVFR